jgi:hypothetical protein
MDECESRMLGGVLAALFLSLAAAREVLANHDRMLQKGFLTEDPFWYFVIANAPDSLYQGYKTSLYGLVR